MVFYGHECLSSNWLMTKRSMHLNSFLDEKPSETRALLNVCVDNGFAVLTAILSRRISVLKQSETKLGGKEAL